MKGEKKKNIGVLHLRISSLYETGLAVVNIGHFCSGLIVNTILTPAGRRVSHQRGWCFSRASFSFPVETGGFLVCMMAQRNKNRLLFPLPLSVIQEGERFLLFSYVS